MSVACIRSTALIRAAINLLCIILFSNLYVEVHSLERLTKKKTQPAKKINMNTIRVGMNRQHLVDTVTNKTFVPKGFNIAWPVCKTMPCSPTDAIAYYESYFAQMHSHGANFARIWLGPQLVGSFNTLAMLSLNCKTISANATIALDGVIASAERWGIRLLITLNSFNELCPDIVNNNCHYSQSVWTERNGGPLTDTIGFVNFWSDPDAWDAWSAMARFVVERWAPSPAVLAFQLFNEVDAAMFDILPSAYAWHKKAVKLVRESDQYGHLVSESFGLPFGNPLMDWDVGFDVTTTHYYARNLLGYSTDIGPAEASWTSFKIHTYGKPSWIEEFGCNDYNGEGTPTRAALHDGIWAPIFGGAAATGAFWHWYEISETLWGPEFEAIGYFLESLPFDLASFKWVPISLPLTSSSSGASVVGVSANGINFMLWLHNKNGTAPCVAPATTIIDPFSLVLGLDGNLPWTLLHVNTTTGHSLPWLDWTLTDHGLLSIHTPPLGSDLVLVGFTNSP